MDDVAGASVFYGVLDAGSGRIRYAVAGHPAPLVVHPDGSAESLPVTPRPPLGTVPGTPTVPSSWDLEEGATLVLYSDGALAALGDLSPAGSRQLAAVAGRVLASGEGDAGALAGRLVAALPAEGADGYGERPDDVAVLVAHRCATATEPLVLDLPAVPPSLPRVRRALGRWMTDLGMGEEDQVGLMVAVGEACANSVEHAYRGSGEGHVHVRADVDVDGLMTVTVSDEGTWRPPDRDPGDRGRGLLIMRQLVDDVHIAGGEGTTVTLRSRLRRAPDAEPDGAPPLGASVVTVDRSGPQPVVRVAGGVDLAAAEHLRIRLLEASHGGTVPVWLDLAAATVFGSAAVRVVLGIARIARDEGWTLQVRVPANTPARHVLEVSGIGDLVTFA
jgi:anti-sigma regulatory factor (Ser/Thr protein kinase)/anti-anti-sigma regulatory factor